MPRPRSSHLRLFDYFAPLYDLGIWFLLLPFGGEERFRERVLAEALPLKGLRVLELCAGTATLSLLAIRMGADVTSLDLSEGMLRVALAKSEKTGVPLRLVRSDAGELPFADRTFDVVIVSFGLHELPGGQAEEVMRESFRVLKGGGRFVLLDYYRARGIAGLLQRLLFVFIEGEEARGWVALDVQKLLRDIGFKGFRRKFAAGGALQVVAVEKR